MVVVWWQTIPDNPTAPHTELGVGLGRLVNIIYRMETHVGSISHMTAHQLARWLSVFNEQRYGPHFLTCEHAHSHQEHAWNEGGDALAWAAVNDAQFHSTHCRCHPSWECAICCDIRSCATCVDKCTLRKWWSATSHSIPKFYRDWPTIC